MSFKTKYVLVHLWFLSLNYFSKHTSKRCNKTTKTQERFRAHKASILATILTGRSTLTSVPSSKDTRQVMIDFASPAAGMCVVALWASRNRAFSACFRMERRPSVLRRKLSMMWEREGYSTTPVRKEEKILKHIRNKGNSVKKVGFTYAKHKGIYGPWLNAEYYRNRNAYFVCVLHTHQC